MLDYFKIQSTIKRERKNPEKYSKKKKKKRSERRNQSWDGLFESVENVTHVIEK